MYVMLGGAFGASARYLLSEWIYSLLGVSFPWGTLFVNTVGSFLMGILWGVFQSSSIPPEIKIFALVGFLGSFTTFSTFSFENFELLKNNEGGLAVANIIASVVIGLLMIYLGFLTSKLFLNFAK